MVRLPGTQEPPQGKPNWEIAATPSARGRHDEAGGLPRSSDEGPVMGLESRGQVIAVDLGQPVRREEVERVRPTAAR
jgi:hypothetical protein